MKFCFGNKQCLNIFLLISLAALLILPEICIAEDFENITLEEIEKHLQLPANKVEDLIRSLINLFHSEWIRSFDYATAEESAVAIIMKKVAQIQALNYLLIDAPIEVTGTIVKNAVEIARLVSVQDISVVLDKFEKESVDRAVQYGMDFLLQEEIRMTSGVIEFKYTTRKGETKVVIFQYIMIYQPIDAKRGELVIRFYSSTSLEPPENKGSYGMVVGIYTELTYDLPPFIVDIQGIVENYQWVGEPSIKIDLSGPVPDLGIKPLSLWGKYLLKPVETAIKEVEIVITRVTGTSLNLVDLWNKIKSFFSEIKSFSPAALFQPLPISPTPAELEEIKEEFTALEEEITKVESSEPETEPNQKPESKPKEKSIEEKLNMGEPLTLEEIQELLDDIVERIDILSQRIDELVALSQPISEEIIEEEETEEEVDQEETRQKLCEKIPGSWPTRNRTIINEVAWMGNQNSASDEWIELKNISGAEIDLTNWQLLDKDGQIKIIFSEKDQVSVNELYLLERTDDDSVLGLAADLIYTGGLNNTNEVLYLFDANCQLQDEILADPDWPAGNSSSKRTMERKNALIWQTSSYIGGTPKRENSEGYYEYYSSPSPPSLPAICSQENLTQPTYQPVIFNEIAWMGSASSSADEWLELKNISTSTASLNNWQLIGINTQNNENKIKIFFDGSDAIDNLFLLERSDDDSVPGISANKIFSGSINDSDFILRLFNNECILIDEVGATSTWPAGQKTPERRTMERGANLNWYISSATSSINGLFGTPKAENSQPIETPPEEPQPPIVHFAENVVISEAQIAEEEFIELYNPTESDIDISSWYFSYFSSNRDWNNPYRNKNFSESGTTTIISAKNYFLIGLKGYPKESGNPNSDWQVYETELLDNEAGAIGIFSCNPKIATSSTTTLEQAIEQVKTCKIDVLGWGEVIVKEEKSASIPSTDKSLARKLEINEDGYLNYIDTDDNKNDFEIQELTPKARNKSLYSDLDQDGVIDSFDPETIVSTTTTLKVGEYIFKDLVIKDGGKLILNSSSSLTGFQGVKIKAINLAIDLNSAISADGKGFSAGAGRGEGPGGGNIGGCGGSGGGYGGKGGDCGSGIFGAEGGLSYGPLKEPIDLGSGGGGFVVAPAGAGGGAIKIEVENNLTLNGIISANGESGSYSNWGPSYSGGGSGGSIYIITNNLTGSGQILANGGNSGNNDSFYGGGGGAGGRIAIYYQTSDFSGKITAFGGLGTQSGGAGTIFLKSANQEHGDLIIDNNNYSGATTFLDETDNTFDNLKLINGAYLILTASLNVFNSPQIENGVALEFENSATISTNNLILKDVFLIGKPKLFLTINVSDFSLQLSNLIGNFNITATNLNIDASSSISADVKGYSSGEELGKGNSGENGGSGAGYGGKGGDCPPAEGGLPYGLEEAPTDLGSGGGGYVVAPAGAGGGAIKIEVENNLTLDGIISANGESGSYSNYPGDSYSGGGSGGSIYIITNNLTGSGLITANGGDGGKNDSFYGGGGGAGGRIAIYYQTSVFEEGNIYSNGGKGISDGEAGTIYIVSP
jgi:hypothetical protein